MNPSEKLDRYLQTLRLRLHTYICVRGALLAAGGVLILTAALVWLLASSGYAQSAVWIGRGLLAAFLLTIVLLLVWRPLRQLARDDGAREFERRLPQERGRIATYLDMRRREARDGKMPLVELLADDAARIAAEVPVETIVSRRRIGFAAAAAIAAGLALVGLLTLAPGHWGYASRHLLLGAELPRAIVPVRNILVTPGDTTVRRDGDLAIAAKTEGFRPQNATVFVRFDDQEEWERAPMQSASQRGDAFAFKLFALRGPLKYFVEADGARSAEHTVAVVDLPRIERIRLTYRYPGWTGLEPQIDEASRDIRAVAGTDVDIEVFSDAPLQQPELIHDDRTLPLNDHGVASAGTLAIGRPGRYHIAANVAGERVALSDEYAIEIVADEKPSIRIEKPGRDWRATNIEEVPVRVHAEDDFRLGKVELRYAVNGGEWRSLTLDRSVKQSRAQHLLELEQLGAELSLGESNGLLAPGDLVSYYAVASDHKHAVKTDLFMVQVQPFERRFLQQTGGGGGGGMGDDQGAISERQREILLATWNLQRSAADERRPPQQLKDNASMLAEMQATLAQQARTLATRTRARAQVDADERVKTFVESLERAALAMDPAALHLGAFELDKAVPVEQQALQQLLRAESAFREVQVSMQSEPGGRGAQAARDFSEMFELEMDVEKSQYENQSQVAQHDTEEEMSEALRRLKELAQRQEQLAQEASRSQSMTPEQRWRQEQLRREAEDLRRQLAAMSQRQSPSQQPQSSPQSGSQQSQGAMQGSEQGSERDSEQRSAQSNALESVDRALEDMQAANQDGRGPQEQGANAAREAGRNLRAAAEQLDRPAQSGLDEALDELAQRANRLANQQRRIESDLYESLSDAAQLSSPLRAQAGGIDPQRAQALVESKQQMAEELEGLQKDLRESVHEHRAASGEAKQRLAEIVNDAEASDLLYRVRRSAAEIYYGRARDAAAREGIITESLDMLEQDLKEAAAQAGREGVPSRESDATEGLLAEVAELRRRIEARQRSQDGNDSQSASLQPSGEGGPSTARGPRGGAAADTGDVSLSGWDPVLPNANARERGDSLARQSAEIAERARRLGARAGNRELTEGELASLRSMARELRQLAVDPSVAESGAMRRAVEQVELTALAAFVKSQRVGPSRTAIPAGDSPEYREAVAEYYRRLGGS